MIKVTAAALLAWLASTAAWAGMDVGPINDASQLVQGTLAAGRLPALTGYCSLAAGTNTLTCGGTANTNTALQTFSGGLSATFGVFTGAVRHSSATGLSAAGTTLATATALTADINEVTTVASGAGVSLAAYNASQGGVQKQEVVSVGANALSVYPPTTSAAIRNLNGSSAAGTAGAAVSLAVGSHATFECVSATLCYEAP